jgi:hypothetical protein
MSPIAERGPARIVRQLVVVVSRLLDRGTQTKLIEDAPATRSVLVRRIADRACHSFFSSSQRFSVYEVSVLAVSCRGLPRHFSASRQTLQLFARQRLSPHEDVNLFADCPSTMTFSDPRLNSISSITYREASLVGTNGTYSASKASLMLTARYLEGQDKESPSAGFWLVCHISAFGGGRGTKAKIGT